MNAILEQLLTVRSSRDLCHKELDLNAELAACLNEVQNAKLIREAKVHCTTTAYTLQQVHKESVLVLEGQVGEEGQVCQAFMGAFGAAIGACLPENWGALLYPIQLLTGNVPLATLLVISAITQLWPMAYRVLAPAAPAQECWRCQHHQQAQNTSAIPQTKVYWPQGRKKRKQWNLTTVLKSILAQNKKREGWQQRSLRNHTARPSPKSQKLWGWPCKSITRPTHPTSSRSGWMTSPAHFNKWLPPLTSWALRFMRCRRTGVAGGIPEPPTSLPSPLPRTSTSLGLYCPPSCQK